MAFWKAGPIPINTWTACVKLLADALTGDDRIKSIRWVAVGQQLDKNADAALNFVRLLDILY